jgi:hypothetical protein
MARPKLPILAAALLAALCGSTPLSAQPLNDADRAEAVAAHNDVRQRVAQEETMRLGGTVSLPPLTWDPAPAAVAQEWAELLVNKEPPQICHRCGAKACNPPLIPNQCPPNALGENIHQAWSTGTPDRSAGAAVKSWADERPDYNYDQNSCATDKQCGHYTQIVWSSTQRVGCGRASRTAADGKNYVIWVCNYAPPGNITGQRPYEVPPPPPVVGTTRHFVDVHFTKIRVHNCNEGGTCAWRLSCGLGGQPDTMLLDNVDGDDLEEPAINRVLTREGGLPVTVTCKLEERDAPIYEHLGTQSLTIQTGGANTIRIADVDEDGDIDEGDVSIFMEVLGRVQQGATEQPPPPPPPPPAPRRDTLISLGQVGIDFSVPEQSIREWLANSSFTPYPALASTLLRLLEGKRLRQPVYLDVIAWNYEHAPGATSPRSESDVDLALLKAAVLEGHNERYGEAVTDFDKLVDVITVLNVPAQPVAEAGMGQNQP